MEIPPVREAKARVGVQAALAVPGTGGASSKPLTTAEVDGSVVDLGDLEAENDFDPGWLLLLRAAAHCGALDLSEPWRGDTSSWYIFPGKYDASTGKSTFQSCSDLIRHEELLICTADTLAQIADVVIPITWELRDSSFIPGWFPEFNQPWRIPIQNSKDRFIVRNLAINVLANLARLDLDVPTSGGASLLGPDEACVDAFARSTLSQGDFDALKNGLYGPITGSNEPTHFEPKLAVTFANAQALAAGRLGLNAHLLRASGRLLRGLIEDSVYADFAGAESQRGHAGDPARGTELMWGVQSDYDQPYNSLAHAFRVLYGRWESGLGPLSPPNDPSGEAPIPAGDPTCGGHLALDVLHDALDDGFSARWHDRMVRTSEQAQAVAMIQKSGIVIPKAELDLHASSLSTIRTAIADQLILNAARDIGAPSEGSQAYLDFLDGSRDEAIRGAVDEVADEDLRFALERSFDAYRVMTGEPDSTPSAAVPGPLAAPVQRAPGASVHSSLAALDAAVLTGSIPKLDAGIDFRARAAGGLAASQCEEYVPGATLHHIGKTAAFQDSFMIGETYRKRLSVLREKVLSTSEMTLDADARADLATLADSASAELRAWTGPGAVLFTDDGVHLKFTVTGLTPKDLAVETVAAMKDQLVLVWGPPWVAECAAKTRSSCPPDFWDDYVVEPAMALSQDDAGGATLVSAADWSDGRLLYLEFPIVPASVPQFDPVPTEQTFPTKEFLHLVAKGDPANPGKGRVLGSYAFRRGNKTHLGTISNLRSKLTEKLFGFDLRWKGSPPDIAEDPSSSPSASCVEGVPRDFFVPLENELTSDSDGYENSWKHYLTLADQAAAETDQICREIIDLGLQKDLRRESAGEELAKICGDFSALDEIEFDGKGLIKPHPTDKALNSCLSEPTVDVVFLSSDPYPTKTDQEKSDLVKANYLFCSGVGASNPLCDKPLLTVEALGIAEAVDPGEQFGAEACEKLGVTQLARDFNLSLPATETAFGQLSALSPADLGMAVGSLRMIVDDELHWELLSNGSVLMSTTEDGFWPRCIAGGPPCSQNPASIKLHAFFSAGIGSSLSPGDRDLALQRVSGAMWTMGALAGWMPEGRFILPVPAANFTVLGGGADPEPGFAIFGAGEFEVAAGDDYMLTLSDSTITGADRAALGLLNPMKQSFWEGAGANSELRPPWVRALYLRAQQAAGAGSTTNGYLHVTARTPSLSFDHDDVKAQLPTAASPAETTSWLAQIGGLVQGLTETSGTCNASTGSGGWLAVYRLGALKRSADQGTLCSYKSTPLMANSYRSSPWSPLSVSQRVGYLSDLVWSNLSLPCKESGLPGTGKICYSTSAIPGPSAILPAWLEARNIYGARPNFHGNDCSPIALPVTGPFDPTGGGEAVAHYAPSCVLGPSTPVNPTGAVATRRITTYCGKDTRAELYVNSHVPRNPCQAVREIGGAYALACMVKKELGSLLYGGESMPAPEIHTPEDIVKFEAWLHFQSVRTRKVLQNLVLQNVPQRVVNDMQEGKAGTGALKGEFGQLILQHEQGISSIISGWLAIEAGLKAIAGAIGKARIDLKLADLQYESALGQIAMSQLQVQMQVAKAAVKMANGIESLSSASPSIVSSSADAALDVYFAEKMNELLEQQKNVANKTNETTIMAVLQDLQTGTSQTYGNLQTSLEGLRAATLGTLSTGVALQQKQSEAQYAAAKGAGKDWVEVGTGEKVSFPVNAVLRRQYSIAERRYKESLRNAKYMAYVARLAIEQRIGQRLEEIDGPVGVLEPPSTWAEDICKFQGCNYEALSEVEIPDIDAGPFYYVPDYAAEADPYIGDYVKKLRNFVEYYNIAYPAHEGDDVAVLSVRDDLLGPSGQCSRESANLLHYSHDLQGSSLGGEGWNIEACSLVGDKCVVVSPGAALQASAGVPDLPPPTGTSSGMSWLHDVTNPPFPTPTTPGGAPPPHSVYQSLELTANTTYVLSWWDLARASDGTIASAAPAEPYTVAVYDSAWQLVKVLYQAPPFLGTGGATNCSQACCVGGTTCTSDTDCCSGACIHVDGVPRACASEWSPRRIESFTPASSGEFHVVFAASAAGSLGTTLGSVAIGNVQLEVAPSTNAPTAYEATGASRLVVTNLCTTGDPAAFRAMFDYKCANNECFYELLDPLALNITFVDKGVSKLVGKIAKGNFNYRHVTLAANVVGTGVTDCTSTPTPSCYGSAYLEYTLDHDAYGTRVIDYLGNGKVFDFGSASINRAKAIAAERFITLPIGSADSALLQQPEVSKPEFRGRPLNGSYRFRVYDQPSLVWANVEDIQLILTYRYWARIQKSQTN